MMRPRRSNAARISATADRSPLTAASAARCDTFATFDVWCDCRLIAAATTSGGAISQPTRQPVIAYVFATPFSTTHVSASSGTSVGHRGEPVRAEGEVLVDLVGDDPDAALDRPAPDRLDLVGWVDRAGGVARRDEQERLGTGRVRRVELVDRHPEPRLDGRREHHGHAVGEFDRLRVGRPVRRGQQHLVAGVEEGLERVVDRVLPAVGDHDLLRRDGVAGVAGGLLGDRGAELGEPAASACTGGCRGPRRPRPRPRRCAQASGSRAHRRRSRSRRGPRPAAPWPWRRPRASPTR